MKERQREGIALAKKQGKYKGRKRSLSPEQVIELCTRIQKKEKKAGLAREFEVSRETLYQYWRAFQCAQDANSSATIHLALPSFSVQNDKDKNKANI